MQWNKILFAPSRPVTYLIFMQHVKAGHSIARVARKSVAAELSSRIENNLSRSYIKFQRMADEMAVPCFEVFTLKNWRTTKILRKDRPWPRFKQNISRMQVRRFSAPVVRSTTPSRLLDKQLNGVCDVFLITEWPSALISSCSIMKCCSVHLRKSLPTDSCTQH
jgi:hypothetical protein